MYVFSCVFACLFVVLLLLPEQSARPRPARGPELTSLDERRESAAKIEELNLQNVVYVEPPGQRAGPPELPGDPCRGKEKERNRVHMYMYIYIYIYTYTHICICIYIQKKNIYIYIYM